jgi:hypothetical protein
MIDIHHITAFCEGSSKEVRKHASSTVEVLMVGNKSDLVEKRKVSDEEAQVRPFFIFLLQVVRVWRTHLCPPNAGRR